MPSIAEAVTMGKARGEDDTLPRAGNYLKENKMAAHSARRATLVGLVAALLICVTGGMASADASADREKASEKLRAKLSRGEANAKALKEWFAEASKGRKPPKKATQEAL